MVSIKKTTISSVIAALLDFGQVRRRFFFFKLTSSILAATDFPFITQKKEHILSFTNALKNKRENKMT